MHFFVVVTSECNLKCKYCFGKLFNDFSESSTIKKYNIDYAFPSEINYSIQELKKFIEKDKNPTIILYGGEPLLRINKVKEIMDNVKARYMLQTNGLFLKELGMDYVNKLHNIMLSIDGDKELTDFNRGKGVYDKIIKNLEWLKNNGFKNEIIARMTVDEKTNIYKQVLHLASNKNFNSVHWQIDAQFFNDYKQRNFLKWVIKSYNPNITKLINYWVNTMKKETKVLRIYPFLGITQSLLKNEKTLLRCGAGWAQYAILTDGNIAPCPVMNCIKDFYVGNIKTSNPLKLKKILVAKPCNTCNIYDICGGRCLYANKMKHWGEKGFLEVCKATRHLIMELKNKMPDIKELVLKNKINLSDFYYDKFNSCEIIP